MHKPNQLVSVITTDPVDTNQYPAQDPSTGNDQHLPPQEAVSMDGHADAPAPTPSYEIGYGKPPAKHRFKPGRSGNPKGRPKGVQSVKSLVRQDLDRKMNVTIEGRRRKMSKRELIAQRLVNNAIKGDEKAARRIMEIDGEASEATVADTKTQLLTAEEHQILRNHLKYLGIRNVKPRD